MQDKGSPSNENLKIKKKIYMTIEIFGNKKNREEQMKARFDPKTNNKQIYNRNGYGLAYYYIGGGRGKQR